MSPTLFWVFGIEKYIVNSVQNINIYNFLFSIHTTRKMLLNIVGYVMNQILDTIDKHDIYFALYAPLMHDPLQLLEQPPEHPWHFPSQPLQL